MADKWTTIKEASRLVDRHSRTLHRWIAEGKLEVDKSHRPYSVNIGPHLDNVQETPLAIYDDMPRTLEALRAAYGEMRSERDYLRERVDKLQDTLTDIASKMAEQPALTVSTRRRWRWPWQRDD